MSALEGAIRLVLLGAAGPVTADWVYRELARDPDWPGPLTLSMVIDALDGMVRDGAGVITGPGHAGLYRLGVVPRRGDPGE